MTVGVGDLYSSSGFRRNSEVDVEGILSISQLEKAILLYINYFRKKGDRSPADFFQWINTGSREVLRPEADFEKYLKIPFGDP